jgi:ABC-2 type transport system permease protein
VSAVPAPSLLSWELRQLMRSKLLWLTLMIVGAAFVWGALAGASLHRQQAEAQARTRANEQAWLSDIRARAVKYQRPAVAPVPYWQDPTDIAGFSQYFLLKHSFKPHLPLAPLAVGVSDLLPDRQQIKLAVVFGNDGSYDFQNPRGLALGAFDLAFAVVHLLPIAVVLVAVLAGTYERDRGILRLVAGQSVGPRRWLTIRLASIALVLVPSLALLFILALIVAGTPLEAALPELSAAVAVLISYTLFWLALSFVALSAWPRASGALATLAAIWLVFIAGAPMVANIFSGLPGSTSSAASLVDVQRRVNDELQTERDEVIAAAFRSRPELAGSLDRIPTLDYATRLTFLVPELEKRLEFLRQARDASRQRHVELARWMSFLAPNVGVESVFASLAGTDLSRQWDFEQQSRNYQLRLRAFFYPLLHAEITSPTPYSAYGHFNFTAIDSIPSFEMREGPAGNRVRVAMPAIAWLLFLTVACTSVSLVRLRSWPESL